jgi:threonine dehydrogenase-like Zn-dependent dehydrogenase
MKALLYRKSIPRYALLKLLGARGRGMATGPAAMLHFVELPEPKLPGPRWVRVQPILSGVCGSDLATLTAKGSPYLGPVISMPFVMGHEVVGVVEETGAGVTRVRTGDRVVLQPALGCVVRGIDPPCDACRGEQDALCRNVTRGDISAGIQTGYCRDTGGGWSGSLVAHETQLHHVPDSIPDAAAVLVEPLACALHGVLRAEPRDGDRVLIVGCGSIGLLTIAALRALGCSARVIAVARHAHQREHAGRLGADVVLPADRAVAERYRRWAEVLGAEVLRPELGKPLVLGGADVTFDCVASSQTLDDAIRFTRSGGRLALVGMPGIPSGVDLTPLWYKELEVRAAYAYGMERHQGTSRTTFEMALALLRDGLAERLLPLVSDPYPLRAWREALRDAMSGAARGTVKTVFRPREGSSE